jgi:hydrogenase maturation protease
MKPAVVIGIGNSLRQDDGMGCWAARLLEEDLAPGIADITECHQLTPELASKLENAPVVVFLDAAVNDVPGRVHFQNIHPQEPGAWSHHLSPGQLVGLAGHVNGAAPPAFLISGGVLETDLGDKLTPLGEKCAAHMAFLARWILAKWNHANGDGVSR